MGCGPGDKVHLVLINDSDITVNYNLDGNQASLAPGMQTTWDTCRKIGEGVAKRNINFDAALEAGRDSFISYVLEFCPVAAARIACSYSFQRNGNWLDLFKG